METKAVRESTPPPADKSGLRAALDRLLAPVRDSVEQIAHGLEQLLNPPRPVRVTPRPYRGPQRR